MKVRLFNPALPLPCHDPSPASTGETSAEIFLVCLPSSDLLEISIILRSHVHPNFRVHAPVDYPFGDQNN
jgi:hypothetical protein